MSGEILRIVSSFSSAHSAFSQLLLVGLFAVPVLRASAPKADKYPIQIRITSVSSACASCGPHIGLDEWSVPSNVYYTGHGDGYLLDANTANAFEFSFDLCRSGTPYSVGQQIFAARWKKKGKELELLVPDSFPSKPVSLNAAHFDQCTLKVIVGEPITLEQFQRRTAPPASTTHRAN